MADPPDKPKVIKRPAVPPPIRVRRNVNKLPANDPVILWYRRAIGEMKTQSIDVFDSWRFQAAIHDYVEAEDPNPVKASPTSPGQPFWKACEHAGWFFLPWHRMYLHHFEKIVMDHIVKLGGPSDWALPYWNYSTSAADAKLPVPFQGEDIPAAILDPKLDKTPKNHLFVDKRHPEANKGNDFATTTGNTAHTNISVALAETEFTKPSGNFGFGGPIAQHHTGADKGLLERSPHDRMHGIIGGIPGGFMRGFTTAPLDPIFWLHHCNIDRLWEVWAVTKKNKNPTDKAWTDQAFTFRNSAGTSEPITPAEVIDTRNKKLLYEYDDISA